METNLRHELYAFLSMQCSDPDNPTATCKYQSKVTSLAEALCQRKKLQWSSDFPNSQMWKDVSWLHQLETDHAVSHIHATNPCLQEKCPFNILSQKLISVKLTWPVRFAKQTST